MKFNKSTVNQKEEAKSCGIETLLGEAQQVTNDRNCDMTEAGQRGRYFNQGDSNAFGYFSRITLRDCSA